MNIKWEREDPTLKQKLINWKYVKMIFQSRFCQKKSILWVLSIGRNLGMWYVSCPLSVITISSLVSSIMQFRRAADFRITWLVVFYYFSTKQPLCCLFFLTLPPCWSHSFNCDDLRLCWTLRVWCRLLLLFLFYWLLFWDTKWD